MCSHIAKSETYDAGRIANRGGVFTVPTLTTKLLSVPKLLLYPTEGKYWRRKDYLLTALLAATEHVIARASPHVSFVIEGITPRYATNHLIEKTGKSQ